MERIADSIDQSLDVNTKVSAALVLLSFCSYSGNSQLAERLLPRITPLATADETLPLNQYYWTKWLAYYLMLRGDYIRARTAFDDMDRLAERYQLRFLATNALLNRMIAAFCEQDIASGRAILEKLDMAARRSQSQDVGMENAARSWGRCSWGSPKPRPHTPSAR